MLVINLILCILSIAGISWTLASGQVGTMDGNFMIAVCGLLFVLFGGSFYSSLRAGELKELFRKNPDQKSQV